MRLPLEFWCVNERTGFTKTARGCSSMEKFTRHCLKSIVCLAIICLYVLQLCKSNTTASISLRIKASKISTCIAMCDTFTLSLAIGNIVVFQSFLFLVYFLFLFLFLLMLIVKTLQHLHFLNQFFLIFSLLNSH
jgi:hypothetical protein